MKKLLLTFPLIAVAAGCARFSTTQTDYSYGPVTNNAIVTYAPTRKITTRVKAWTAFDSSSQLSQFKASQTDKTQGASVGSLSQSSTSTNVANIVNAAVSGAVQGAIKAAK
jgi:hypothetical protein